MRALVAENARRDGEESGEGGDQPGQRRPGVRLAQMAPGQIGDQPAAEAEQFPIVAKIGAAKRQDAPVAHHAAPQLRRRCRMRRYRLRACGDP